jgi:hypothetical protein
MLTRIFLILIAISFQAFAESKPQLSGRWEWLPDESDDPGDLIAEGLEYIDIAALQTARSEGYATPAGAFRRKPGQKQVDALFRFFDSIVPMQPLASIEHREPWLKLIYADGREREIYTDGRDLAASVQTTATRQDQKLQFASWEKNTLVVETNTTSGVSMLERYSLSGRSEKGEATFLRVEIAIDSARLSEMMSINSIYRSAGKQ